MKHTVTRIRGTILLGVKNVCRYVMDGCRYTVYNHHFIEVHTVVTDFNWKKKMNALKRISTLI